MLRVQKSRLLPSLLFRTLEKNLLFWTPEKSLLFWIPGKFYCFGPPICEFLKSLLFWTFRFALENKKSTFLDVTIKDGIENFLGTNHGAVDITGATGILSAFPFYFEIKLYIIYINA